MAKFKGFVRQENVIRFSQAFSPDDQAVTLLFENLLAGVGGRDRTLVATQVASFTLPVSDSATALRVQLNIRGYVQTQPGTRAVLVAHLGDTTALASLPADADYQQDLEATLPAGVDVQTSLFLLAERNAANENLGALLTVDSLDLSLRKLDSGES
jgi:hypothetical protein